MLDDVRERLGVSRWERSLRTTSAQEARQRAAMETLKTDTLIEKARTANRAEHERAVLMTTAKTRARTLSARHREALEGVGGVDALVTRRKDFLPCTRAPEWRKGPWRECA